MSIPKIGDVDKVMKQFSVAKRIIFEIRNEFEQVQTARKQEKEKEIVEKEKLIPTLTARLKVTHKRQLRVLKDELKNIEEQHFNFQELLIKWMKSEYKQEHHYITTLHCYICVLSFPVALLLLNNPGLC